MKNLYPYNRTNSITGGFWRNLLFVVFILATKLAFGQTSHIKEDTTKYNPNYDSKLAEQLGSDDYGMKSYFFVILTTGMNPPKDKELISKSFTGHMDNINRLVAEKKLIVAGPFEKNDHRYRGIFILDNISSIAEAKELLQSDLAVKNGLLDYEIFTWYGSAALSEYLPFSDRIWKIKP